MRKSLFPILLAATLLAACGNKKQSDKMKEENPLLMEWNTPFQAPPFEKIKIEHYMPAFEKGMVAHKEEINKIISSTESPNFENTIGAFNRSGELLNRISAVFFNLSSANTSKEMQALEEKIAPMLTKHGDDISMDAKLFARIKTVYENKASLNLNAEQAFILEETYKSFVRGGANLSAENQTKLRKINEELSVQANKYGKNLLAETNGFQLVVDKKEDLAGLPEDLVASAAHTAQENKQDGKWIFTLNNPSVLPFLQFADNRQLREKIWTAWTHRANNNNANDNKEVINSLVNLQMQKAQLLGYKNYAEFVLEERMAKNSTNVYDLLNKLWTPALANAKKEAAELQKMMDKEGKNAKLEAWDWRYYTEKVRKAKYDLDEEAIKPYFSLDNVRDGVFQVSGKLYGITFTQIKDAPVYYPDVTVWEVKDADAKHLGIVYMDFYTRASKRGGAWCTSFRDQHKKADGSNVAPILSIVFNFSKPVGDKPVLLNIDEAQTFFHEFGHALHGLFSNVTYKSDVPRDFVELPSQIMENWAMEPEVLKMYAKHYQTKEVMPDALITKIQQTAKFDQGFATTEYLAASLLDMDYYVLDKEQKLDIVSFENSAMNKIGLIKQIPPRYRSTYFSHIFDGGYSAGYYSYIWSAWLDADAFAAFKETGNIFDKTIADKFRKEVLSKSGSMDAMQMYLNFRGKQPSVDPLLERRGLK